MYEFTHYRYAIYFEEPCIIQNKNDYHTRVKCKGSSFVVSNSDLKELDKPMLLITFYKNKEVKVVKEKKFSLIIETENTEFEISKKKINHIFCEINPDKIDYYIEKFGICFTKDFS